MTQAEAKNLSKGSKILVVDNSDFARRVARHILESLGYFVEEASSRQEALQLYEQYRPKMVMLDLVMYEMGGLDLLRELRQLDPQAIVLIVTGDTQRFTRDDVKEAGAAGILIKPLIVDTLRDTLAELQTGKMLWT